MKKIQFNNNNGQQITMAANIFFPDNFDEGKTYPAINSHRIKTVGTIRCAN